MSRSGYHDDGDQWALIRWRGAVASAIRGKRGQAFLQEMLMAMDALPERKLIRNELDRDGAVCALGAVGRARGLNMSSLDPEDPEHIADIFGVPPALAREIMFENDEHFWGSSEVEPDTRRFERMRRWVESNIK